MKKNTILIILFFITLFFCGKEIVFASGLGVAQGEFENIAKTVGATTYSTPESLIGVLMNVALTFTGLIFLILMIYAGYLWMTARGEEEQVGKAVKIVSSSIIGFVLVAGAYGITTFIGKSLEKGGSGTAAKGECSQLGQDWKCDNIDSCLANVNGFDITANISKKRDFCDANNVVCQTGVCSGGSEMICCKNGTDGGDPNVKMCMAECNYQSSFDFTDYEEENVVTEPDPELVEWVSEVGFNAKKSVCDSKKNDCFVVGLSNYTTEEACKAAKENLNCEDLCLEDIACATKLLK